VVHQPDCSYNLVCYIVVDVQLSSLMISFVAASRNYVVNRNRIHTFSVL